MLKLSFRFLKLNICKRVCIALDLQANGFVLKFYCARLFMRTEPGLNASTTSERHNLNRLMPLTPGKCVPFKFVA